MTFVLKNPRNQLHHPVGAPNHVGHQQRLDIQSLRAIAVLGVVMYHFWPESLRSGFVGVDIFFVISGYLVGGPLVQKAMYGSSLKIWDFYARRIKRILPSAYLTIILSLIAALVLLPDSRWISAAHEAQASILYFQNYLLAGQSVDYLAQDSPDSLFRHFWSLSLEEQFYIFTPIVLVFLAVISRRFGLPVKRVVLGAMIIATFASLAYAQVRVASGNPSAYFDLLTRFWELSLGALIFVLPRAFPCRISTPEVGTSSSGLRPRLLEQSRNLLFFTGLAAIIWALLYTSSNNFPGFSALPAVVGTCAVILARIEPSSHVARGFSNPVMLHFGNISYNLYLAHWPVMLLLPYALSTHSWFYAVALVGVSYGLAIFSYYLIDRPIQRVKISADNRRFVLLAGLVSSVVLLAVVQLPADVAGRRQTQREATATELVTENLSNLGFAGLNGGNLKRFSISEPVLLPDPSIVRAELPTGAEGRCKSGMSDPFTPKCEFGVRSPSTPHIALVGDSHMEQYLPAFEQLLESSNFSFDTYFHSSCPFSTAQRQSDNDRNGPCAVANEKTLELLTAGHYDHVITSNRTAVPWMEGPEFDTPQMGFGNIWNALNQAGLSVTVLSDNPLMLPAEQTTECLIVSVDSLADCDRLRTDAIPVDFQLDAVTQFNSDNFAERPGVFLVDTSPWFCDSETCFSVIGNAVVYRDEQHISVLYAKTLAGVIRQSLIGSGLELR